MLDCYFVAVAVMADVEVLAKDTTQIAAGKKYGARAAGADENTFLAEMRGYRADYGFVGDAAKTPLAFAAIDSAIARTKCTWVHTLGQNTNRFANRTVISW